MSMKLSFEIRHDYIAENDAYLNKDHDVFTALDSRYGRKVIIKTQKIADMRTLPAVENEAKAMIIAGQDGINVPHIYETFFDSREGRYYIVMEFIDGKTLSIQDHGVRMEEEKFISCLCDLCGILKSLEKYGIHHKDIKPENIMIRDNKLFLIDFNISISLPNPDEGTKIYKAPEMDKGSRFVTRDYADIFSIGVIMYEYYAKKPIRGIDYVPSQTEKSWKRFREPKEVNPQMRDLANAIVVKCMEYDPRRRYGNAGNLQYDLLRLKKEIGYDKRKQNKG